MCLGCPADDHSRPQPLSTGGNVALFCEAQKVRGLLNMTKQLILLFLLDWIGFPEIDSFRRKMVVDFAILTFRS